MTVMYVKPDPPSPFPLIALAILLVMSPNSCFCGKASAQDAPPAVVEPHPAAPMTVPAEFTLPDTRIELRRTTLAPFDGILFDAPTLVRWVNRIQWLETRLHLEHDLHVSLEDATRQSYQTLMTQLTESYEREIATDRRLIDETQETLERAQRRIAELERHPPHRAFAIGAGLGAGLVLAAGITGAVIAH